MAPGETAGKDSYLDFTATVAGTYYVGVSGKGNEVYDPLSLGNRTGPASVGGYQIEINVLAPQTWVITAVDGTQVADGTTFTVSDVKSGDLRVRRRERAGRDRREHRDRVRLAAGGAPRDSTIAVPATVRRKWRWPWPR